MSCCILALSAGPIRLCGGRIFARSTTPGTPSASRKLTSASPTPSSMSVCSVSNAGFTRNARAAARTDFCSAGV